MAPPGQVATQGPHLVSMPVHTEPRLYTQGVMAPFVQGQTHDSQSVERPAFTHTFCLLVVLPPEEDHPQSTRFR
jgi:hypothetical protein